MNFGNWKDHCNCSFILIKEKLYTKRMQRNERLIVSACDYSVEMCHVFIHESCLRLICFILLSLFSHKGLKTLLV
jgi:hypothetical protein